MVVVGSPLVDFMSGTGQAQKPVLIETAIPELAVEALDEGILCRLTRLDEGQRDLPKNIALLVSSGPLSQTIEAGSERCCATSSRNLAKRRPEMDVSTS